MELSDYRDELDVIDREITALFARRMEICGQIGAFKVKRGLPVLDTGREQEKLERVANLLPEELKESGKALFRELMRLSRDYQTELICKL